MNLKQCLLTANSCYKKGTKMKNLQPTGIVVHSTGANNPYLKRYVQPLKTDANYKEIMKDLGVNSYGNHWNEPGRNACVHAFIGKTANKEIATYQTLPFTYCCWGCGSGKKGSYNSNPQARIQFEICEDALNDKAYFTAVFQEAAEFCAYLCKQYNLSVSQICSHAEAYKAGYGTNHGDPDHWLKKFGKTMDDFREMVKALLEDGKATVSETQAAAPATPQKATATTLPYLVKVTADALNFRKGPGTNYKIAGTIRDKGTYTIVEESAGKGATKWGKLKSGAGWISLDYTKKK